MNPSVVNVDIEALGLEPGAAVLDLGCGDGHLARELVRAGFRVCGVEPEARLRAAFEALGSGLDPSVYSVIDARAEALPFPDGTWSAVTMTEVLEHVSDPAAVLGELHRVLAGGGKLCLSVPTSFTERLYSRLHPQYTENATHVRVFSKSSLTDLLRASGFRVLLIEGKNFVPAVSWVFHALLRSRSNHAGEIQEHLWIDRGLALASSALDRVGLLTLLNGAGDRIFPKSWYVYAEKTGVG